MTLHPDCESVCQILEHKGYHTCTYTGRCEYIIAREFDDPLREIQRLIEQQKTARKP